MENNTKMKINCVIGIDPGANGGIAVFVPGEKVKTVKMPKEIVALSDFLNYYKDNYRPVVFLEKLSVRPDDVAVGPNEKANMGKMYRIQNMIANYEQLKSVIEIVGIPFALVHPMTWQTKLKLRIQGSKEEKADRKRRYKQVATQNYPEINITLWNADALLIMHFGRWALVNNPDWVRANIPSRERHKLFE